MTPSHRVLQITVPGTLELVEHATPVPGAGQLLIKVEACEVCDDTRSPDTESADPALQPRQGAGHEMVGRIMALGENVPSVWKLGQRVGVGSLEDYCYACPDCRRGQFQLCGKASACGTSIVSALLAGLAPPGRLLHLGYANDPLAMHGGQRARPSSITGKPFRKEKTVAFNLLKDARALMKTLPQDAAAEDDPQIRQV
ncbi:hypothetical protein MPL3365_130590 [Mesorhizobium plurifarium]|uniref:Alcohol dehydrogenase-like N-terminal domain-containing protein n=1 Tax=Mesorhizobium plurifarium TaxID=69974 RepID=A0A090FX89_MESPL|nr:hypothetical protein MPL3365_130590 [Mesorhizobium plurifarium]